MLRDNGEIETDEDLHNDSMPSLEDADDEDMLSKEICWLQGEL